MAMLSKLLNTVQGFFSAYKEYGRKVNEKEKIYSEEKIDPKEQYEAAQSLLDDLHSLQDSLYNEKAADIDRERAKTFLAFYSSIMDTCAGNPEKEKAFKDVISTCVLLKRYPNATNSRLLDDKLDIAHKYLDEQKS